MDLDLRLLRGFVTVAQELNFSRAADRLQIAQPALTRQIRSLERTLDAKLFQRTTRRVTLTAAGEALLDPAGRALAAADEGADAARVAAYGGPKRLRVALTASGNLDFAPALLSEFRARHVGVFLEVSRLATALAISQLHRRELDVALTRPPLHNADELSSHILFEEPMLAVLPSGHRLAAHELIRRDQLAQEPFVMFPRALGPGGYDLITGYLWPDGSDPESHIVEHRPEEETMIEAVAAGLGVTVSFASRAKYLAIPGVTCRQLDPPLIAQLAVAWRAAERNPLVSSFIELADQLASERR